MLAEYQSAMSRVTSMDGTSIAFDRQGNGPPVILVGGGLVSRADGVGNNAPLATELSQHFTVYNYDRRGRGESGDILPYSSQREIEDIEALVAEAGGSAHPVRRLVRWCARPGGCGVRARDQQARGVRRAVLPVWRHGAARARVRPAARSGACPR